MQVGIMGGTFDPVHQGHLLAAELAREAGGFDEVWFMPSYAPPHKQPGPVATPGQRLEMVRLAIADHPSFRTTDIEIRMGGTSYTYDTVEMLQGRYPSVRFTYIIGGDMVMYLPKWYRINELVERIGFMGLARPGAPVHLELLPASIRSRVTLVPMLQMELSSTEIRRRRHEGLTVRYMVPEAVRMYMEVNRLYEG
ncbi:MAG: nicotinate (nicotinamide) nucleotide adenylyltransferase [Paenibacillaceae bacterium]|jgi:nicotinate-nucleotide adenylyltransferase|nr:nicotinate (nicotinamide) nucleotide adenylyltransferase [Paenibacillaceae bacterium]